jgi:acetyl esterase/lipase
VDSTQFRPDAAILSYPVITYTPGNMSFDNLLGHPATDEEISLLSLEKSVSDQNPPTFLWATVTDEMVPVQNTLCYANALLEQGVSLELHLFPKGPHAMSTATRESAYARRRYDDPHVAMWTELCAQWLTGL